MEPVAVSMTMKVLIVDDSQLITHALSFMVSSELGFEPVIAESYAETKAKLAEHGGDGFLAAIVDMGLPDARDGQAVDLTLEHKVPTVVLSATFEEEVRQRILKKGVVDYLVKKGSYSYEYAIRIIRRLDRNRHCRALVVEASAETRTMLRELLSLYNLPVVEAGNGKEAIAMLERHPDIQLVLTGDDMPEMDGFDFVHHVRKRVSYEELIVIGLADDRSGTISAKFIKNGANDFLRKPFSFEELQCRIMLNLETMENVREISRSANVDYLTQLHNRRYFFEQGKKKLDAAKHQGGDVAVAIMDLDLFKNVNDIYGHDVGDQVLVHIAEKLQALPDSVMTARLGGEEFGLLFVGQSLEAAHQQLEAFREDVASTPIICDEQTLRVTISAGITKYGDNLNEMLSVADTGLYQAKEAGRNKVIVS
jgi:diguanylate cyclase (GGDEF)-like protein